MSKRKDALNKSSLPGLSAFLSQPEAPVAEPAAAPAAAPQQAEAKKAETPQPEVKETYRLPMELKFRFEKAFMEMNQRLRQDRKKLTRNELATAILDVAIAEYEANGWEGAIANAIQERKEV